MKSIRWSFWAISVTALAGCSYLSSSMDREISKMAAQVQPIDTHPAYDQAPTAASEAQPPQSSRPASPENVPLVPAGESPAGTPKVEPDMPPAGLELPPPKAPEKQGDENHLVLAVALQQPEKKPPPRLVVPPNLPGAKAPLIEKYPESSEEQKRFLQEFFPPMPPAPQMRPPAPGPEGRPMTLADLQRLAALYSPAIKNAEAAVEAAKGAAKQAGAYPNPFVFFEQDTVGTGSMGYQGFGLHQTVVTAGKLKLQQAAAMMDLLIAQLALKRAYIDLAYQVRTNYFALLVAREGVKINQALYEFTEEVYRVQVEMVQGQLSAPYEALQLRPLALQARFSLIQAQNLYLASWRQLVAAMGLRNMPLTEVVGQIDMPVPVFEYNGVLARVLANHTDVRTAVNEIQQAKFNLQLAKVTPLPNVDLNILGQKDGTAPPNVIAHSLQASIPIPIFNQNLGGIKQATGQLIQAQAQLEQTRNTLTQSLADAFNRYATNRANVAITLQQVQDQVRAYRMLVGRRWFDPIAVAFGDQVVAQQLLGTYITNYITALGQQWLAVCDVANLLQTDDLFQVGPTKQTVPVPDLKQLAPRPGLPPCASKCPPWAPRIERTYPAAGDPAQPAPVDQPTDAADDKRSREASNPKRG
jgi:cobalt-zinc-cadmium efflux system outer membrane protein